MNKCYNFGGGTIEVGYGACSIKTSLTIFIVSLLLLIHISHLLFWVNAYWRIKFELMVFSQYCESIGVVFHNLHLGSILC